MVHLSLTLLPFNLTNDPQEKVTEVSALQQSMQNFGPSTQTYLRKQVSSNVGGDSG